HGNLIFQAVEEHEIATCLEAADLRADAAELKTTNRAESTGEEALIHRCGRAGPGGLTVDREHVLAAAVGPRARGEILGEIGADDREGEVADALLEADIQHATLGGAEERIA